MRVMPIRIVAGTGRFTQMKASFVKNWKYYLQEALGLGIFMVSACFFSAELFSQQGILANAFTTGEEKNIMMGLLMGLTALVIFYSPFTAPSGSQINPAVTITFWRLNKMCQWDAIFYITFQLAGGTVAVYAMQLLVGEILVSPPVTSAVTVPGKYGVLAAMITEFVIAFITMVMVLFTANDERLKRYTRIIAACLVCCWVILAGPISGFGMNPARTFASALPAHVWTAFWLYVLAPVAGMLAAAELFLWYRRITVIF